ncbi:MAG TPA: GGDEF domain-containing protein [Paucimonas sp.]|nr:GGDEF domain-containing protein [Paucimonas sp.]
MKKKNMPLGPSTQNVEQMLDSHNRRVLYPLSIAGILFMTPFVINNFLHERYLLGVVVGLVVFCLAVDAWAMRRGRPAPIPYALLLIPVMAATSLSLYTRGIYGALWAYPAVLFCYFVLSRVMANICSAAFTVIFTLQVAVYLDTGIALRFFLTLALVVAIVNIRVKLMAELQTMLLEQSITDPLTGAFNRRHMDACLRDAIERNKRNRTPASMLIIDIDHFKRINDQYGHESGDYVLQSVVALVRQRARRIDRLFRIGGEEFLLLLTDTRTDGALTMAEDLRNLIADAHILEQQPVTVSIGISELQPSQSSDAWIRQADNALYRAKENGRNRVALEEEAVEATLAAG